MSLVSFDFKSTAVRTVTDDKGEVLFVGKDVCEILGYSNPSDAMKQHCRGVAIRHHILDSLGRTQEVRALTDLDVMRLVLACKIQGTDSLKDELLSKISDASSIIKALNDFEVPDDIPEMFVYAIRNADTGHIKLGISRNPEQRLKQLQTANSAKLELVAYRKAVNGFQDEKQLHNDNSEYRIRGEWFTQGEV